MLLVSLDEARVKNLALVGLAIAVGVFGVENVRSGRDENALAPGQDAGGVGDFEKDRCLVVAAVAVGVFESSDLPAAFEERIGVFCRRFVVFDSQRVIAHFDDPQFAIGSEGERNGVKNERLGGHQLDFESGLHANAAARRLGRARLRRKVGGLGQNFVERPAVDEVGELGGVFVLPIER